MEELLTEKIAVETARYCRYLACELSPKRSYWSVIQDGLRHQSAINRQIMEAIKELERLQTKRRRKRERRSGPLTRPVESQALVLQNEPKAQ